MVQIAVLMNHVNGRDTHMRQIKLFGPQQRDVLPPHFSMLHTESCIIR